MEGALFLFCQLVYFSMLSKVPVTRFYMHVCWHVCALFDSISLLPQKNFELKKKDKKVSSPKQKDLAAA